MIGVYWCTPTNEQVNYMHMHILKVTCDECSANKTIEITYSKWLKYVNGELVQNVWPELTDAEREIIIGFRTEMYTCLDCWNKLFSEPEEIYCDVCGVSYDVEDPCQQH